jgi:REP element-mobilizing transposase RayT
MKPGSTYYRRNLPHYQQLGYVYFITARLAGTIPRSVYEKIRKNYSKELVKVSGYKNLTKRRRLYYELQEKSFQTYDSILDKSMYGEKWLSDKPVASLLKKSLHFRDEKEYELYAYTIMPNHIHLIIKPILLSKSESASNRDENKFIVTKIIGNFKKFTGREANKILKRSGQFWQHESYDHLIRGVRELQKLTEYILNNPVKAKLCELSDDWNWNYHNPKYYL